ncbi:MAG: helix-turn-helix transcriptional regulator [Clostridia bacterium]|nr:helix-turn-helix transcriptional regulator [Clostridia bacterium]
MDTIKIGAFIAECRKKKNLTQKDLADKLFVTDRAVSKWERGRAVPDSSIMLDLCNELKISVNELLAGEYIEVKDFNKHAETNLIEITKQKEDADRRLLKIEIVLGYICSIFFIALIFLASYIQMATWLRVMLIVGGFVLFFIGCFVCVRIEQVAGYYECKHCHHKYVPTYAQTNWAMHLGRTRYLKCPKCGKKSWSKKVISREDC